jgi:hypothetical protein
MVSTTDDLALQALIDAAFTARRRECVQCRF